MGMVVQHNMSAMNANRNLGVTAGNLAKSTEKLSSGYKINRAGDNAAGLAISEKMRGQIRGLDQASSNAEDGISMIQTAEGALTETHSILQRMRELAVQASSDTNTDDDRTQIQNEIDQLTQEVDRIATTTEFNTKKLIDGSAKGAVSEKAGKANVDATFANSNVSAEITTDGSAKAAFSDVIRIEVTADFSKGQSTKGTAKLSDEQMTQLKSILDDKADGLSTDPYSGAKKSGVDASAAKNSFDDALSAAIVENKNQLKLLKSHEIDSSSAVETNKEVVDKLVDDIYSLNETVVKAKNEGFLADGVTKEQLKEAVNNLISAQVEDGKATPASISIDDANASLNKLFSTSGTVYGTAIDATDLEATTQKNDNTSNTKLQIADLADTKKMSEIATAVKKVVTDASAEVSATQVTDNANKKAVANQEELLETLGNKDLVKAAYDYETALADQKTVNGTTGVTAAAKQEAQDKVDVAKAALDKLNTDKSVLTVTDLFGNTDDTKKFEIGSKVDDDNNLTVTLKNKEGDDTVITISNADKMKAGDVITITAKEMVETEQAPTGKDAFRLQVGANAGQEVMLGINSMKAKDLNIVQTKDGVEGKALDVTNQASASLAVNAYDMAIQSVSTERAKLGATQNRLEHTISNLDTSSENLQSAESSLRDTDMAEEMTRYSKSNILQQAGQSMLAQANQSTQGVLNLLG